jgi:hypothetical protein
LLNRKFEPVGPDSRPGFCRRQPIVARVARPRPPVSSAMLFSVSIPVDGDVSNLQPALLKGSPYVVRLHLHQPPGPPPPAHYLVWRGTEFAGCCPEYADETTRTWRDSGSLDHCLRFWYVIFDTLKDKTNSFPSLASRSSSYSSLLRLSSLDLVSLHHPTNT